MKKIILLLGVLTFVLAGHHALAKRPGTGGGDSSSDPSNFVAAAVSSSQINLTWDDNSSSEDGYSLERSLDGSSFSEVQELSANSTSFSDLNLDPVTEYFYRVRSFEYKGSNKKYSGYSNIDSDVTFDVSPLAPTYLGSFNNSSTTTPEVLLVWTDNADNEDGLHVERGVDGMSFSLIDTLPANSTAYYDSSVVFDETYYYRVSAYNATGESAYSNVSSILVE